MQVIGARVTACRSPDRRNIWLDFSNGQRLVLLNDDRYESIRICGEGREIIL
jgi:hypothetical protein